MGKPRIKPNYGRRVLRLPDLDHCKSAVEMVWNGVLAKLIEQVWEMGERELILIHGHGRNRGITPGFVNTNTGFSGLQV